jgi:hypothetical protein
MGFSLIRYCELLIYYCGNQVFGGKPLTMNFKLTIRPFITTLCKEIRNFHMHSSVNNLYIVNFGNNVYENALLFIYQTFRLSLGISIFLQK